MRKQVFRDPKGSHLRVYHSTMNSPAFRCLSYSARALFFDLRVKLNSTNNGNIEATLSTLKHRGWSHGSTIAKALYELITLGFIIRTRGPRMWQGKGECALFAFTDIPVFEQSGKCQARNATYDYLAFQSVADAADALKHGVSHLRGTAKRQDRERKEAAEAKKKVLLKNCAETGSRTELNGQKYGSEIEHNESFSAQELNTTTAQRRARKTLSEKTFRAAR